jgi:hypothetical protein
MNDTIHENALNYDRKNENTSDLGTDSVTEKMRMPYLVSKKCHLFDVSDSTSFSAVSHPASVGAEKDIPDSIPPFCIGDEQGGLPCF